MKTVPAADPASTAVTINDVEEHSEVLQQKNDSDVKMQAPPALVVEEHTFVQSSLEMREKRSTWQASTMSEGMLVRFLGRNIARLQLVTRTNLSI